MRIRRASPWKRFAGGVCFLWLAAATLPAAPNMKPYTIELQSHILRFSLPEEFEQSILPYMPVLTRFDPLDPTYFRDGAVTLVQISYESRGFLGFGVPGLCWLKITVIRKESEYLNSIDDLDALQSYLRWREIFKEHSGYQFSKDTLNGEPTIRSRKSASTAADFRNRTDLEAYAYPLTPSSFLSVALCIYEEKPGTNEKWRRKAEKIRETVKETIKLEAILK